MTSNLGIPRSAAHEAACKMEHSIDLDMAEKLSNFIERLGAQTASEETPPDDGGQNFQGFKPKKNFLNKN